MTLTIKKMTTALVTLVMIGGITLSIGTNGARSDYPLEASFSTDTTVYLDKTDIIPTLGWWSTDDTYINAYTGTDNVTKMTKINNNIFSAVVTTAQINAFTSGAYGFEFYVYNKSAPQNMTVFVDGSYWKGTNYLYFKISSANDRSNQTMNWFEALDLSKNSISYLTCSSAGSDVQFALDRYSALTSGDQTTIKSTNVPSTSTTYFDRLDYMAVYFGKTRPI